jgi:hypothetical protein
MPKHKKGLGFLDDLKSFGISAAKDIGRELAPVAKEYAIGAVKSALTKKSEQPLNTAGKGLYATNPRGSGYTMPPPQSFKLTPAQVRALSSGKGIQLKPEMAGGEFEFKMTPAMEKKMMKAFAKGKGMRVGANNLMEVKKGGFIVPLLRTAAMIAAPIIIEKLADAGIKKLGGKMGRGKMSDIGMGLFAGGSMPDGVSSDVIQTGSPYQSSASPAMSPFIPSRNPYGMYNPI